MTPFLLIFGLFSGCFVSVLVGLLGSKRNIGFALSFLLSLLLSPIIGLLITLLSDPLPAYSQRNSGCLATTLAILGVLFTIPFIIMLFSLFTMMLASL